jgi:hypothetical protein
MTELISVETNCETGVTTTRPYTAEEVAAHEIMVAENAAFRAEQEAAATALAALKTSARAKLVAGTPLTEAEAATIVL